MTITSSASGAIISSPKSMHVPEKHYALLYNSTAMDRKCVHNSVYSIGITNLLPFHVDQVDAICMSMNFDQYQRKLSWNDKNDNESSHLSWVNWANIAKMISKQADWLESCHIPKHTDMYVYVYVYGNHVANIWCVLVFHHLTHVVALTSISF